MDYKDVAKIMLCFIDTDKKTEPRKATQADIDKLLMQEVKMAGNIKGIIVEIGRRHKWFTKSTKEC